MKVRELIERLKQVDPELPVCVTDDFTVDELTSWDLYYGEGRYAADTPKLGRVTVEGKVLVLGDLGTDEDGQFHSTFRNLGRVPSK
jgi:hypothetical protein